MRLIFENKKVWMFDDELSNDFVWRHVLDVANKKCTNGNTSNESYAANLKGYLCNSKPTP